MFCKPPSISLCTSWNSSRGTEKCTARVSISKQIKWKRSSLVIFADPMSRNFPSDWWRNAHLKRLFTISLSSCSAASCSWLLLLLTIQYEGDRRVEHPENTQKHQEPNSPCRLHWKCTIKEWYPSFPFLLRRWNMIAVLLPLTGLVQNSACCVPRKT